MKNSYSNIFIFNKKILKKTINSLDSDKVAALPTETVYGLGGNAYSKNSIKKIFNLKGRPKSNPLIVHYYSLEKALDDIVINEYLKKLYKYFCPGPNYIYIKKKKNSKIHPLACAKLDTVAVRFPKHKIIRSILKKIKYPLAMPSANKSTSVSPVQASDVFEELGKEVKIIIDGGECKVGIESTVIDLCAFPKILRPGIINKDKIQNILNLRIKDKVKHKIIRSPGIMKKHYSPGIPVKINQKKYDGKSAFIYLGNKHKNKVNFFTLSNNLDLDEAASNLYKIFRLIKKRGYKKIQISKIPNLGSGIAINDRIKRASKS